VAQVSKYRYLLNQYPETVQKEQFRIICHISKRTARYLLQSGLVPCVQSGKKTRNYTIKMKDIVRYLERREIHPEKYKLPPGSYSGTYAVKPLLPESVTTEELRKYYIESFRDIPDIVSTREAAELTGATASTVAKWIRTKKLKALSHGPAFIIPKVNLIDFMASDAYLNKYRHLRDELGMSNEEIGKAGFDLDEFYEDEAADSAEYEVEADYGEEL